MDPIALLLGALVAGAQETASEVIKDVYQGLKALIERKLAGKAAATLALAEHEKKPDIWKAPLVEAFKEAEVDQDVEILTAAQQLMALSHPHEAMLGKFTVKITHAQGVIQGDHATQTNYFADQPGEPRHDT